MAHRSPLTAALAALILSVGVAAPGCDSAAVDAPTLAAAPATVEATIGGRAFTLETALTEEDRFRGLSGVGSLPPDGGMVFAFPDAAPRTFVMRDCLIPLDIVFLDPGGRVIRAAHMPLDPPGTPERDLTPHRSRYPAQFVIELAGGTLETLDLAEGDPVDLPLEALAAAAE